MLEIKPIEDKKEQEEICRRCGLRYSPALFAYKALENGSLLAAAQFDILGSEAVIEDMRQVIGSAEDREALFILGRAVMNFLDLCGVKTATYQITDEASESYASLLGFRKVDGERKITLTGLFDSPCRHGQSFDTLSGNGAAGK